MGSVIRRAEPEDACRIAAIHVESWRAAYSTILRPEVIARMSLSRREEMWDRLLTLPDSDPTRAFVTEVDGDLVGFSLTTPGRDDDLDPSSTAELACLYFVPSHWRRSLGSNLQQRALQELRNEGFQDTVVWVLEENSRALAFYEDTGWKLDKRDPCHQDFQASCLRYHLKL